VGCTVHVMPVLDQRSLFYHYMLGSEPGLCLSPLEHQSSLNVRIYCNGWQWVHLEREVQVFIILTIMCYRDFRHWEESYQHMCSDKIILCWYRVLVNQRFFFLDFFFWTFFLIQLFL
jgi:hypothetical protein